DQFSNPANPEAHRRTTAPELLEQLGSVDAVICAVGTGATITGVCEVLKRASASTRAIALEPAASTALSGRPPGPHKTQGIGAGSPPEALNPEDIDEVIAVGDEAAIDTARLAARREGVLCGISAGAALWAALEVARRPESAGKRIAVVLPDSG